MKAHFNLLADIPDDLPDELLQTLLSRPGLRVERIVSRGHVSPPDFWYDQDQSEFVVVLQGSARLQFDDGELELAAGACVDIPAHRRHRVVWTDPTQPTIWLAIYYDS